MTALDTAQIAALWNVAVDIAGERIPAFYARYGAGAEVEQNVIGMMRAALDCMERATALAVAHEPTRAAMERRVQRMRDHIAEHEAQLAAWLDVPMLIAIDEAEHATKH
ncbi:hypothetical protein NE850_23085 [Paraburkholderia sp. USG1]|uniref:hypothetical protein n=1 Tax=Paraburkholderia sp. USG1 TaxID=2952268 RepID=UPI0028620092|nr:hypothetical protein [Paraburkholderia sp. USG1]MDR8399210.1 hypothetical protein [Paraburkholderia sp. USG1]